MMAKDANDRYSTPQAVIEALAPWTAKPIPPPSPEEMPRRSLAASSPGTQSHAPILPSTPSPRSMPPDMLRARPGSGAPITSKPASKPGPKTPAPANGPRSRPLAPIIRGPAPTSPPPPRRRKIEREEPSMSVGKVVALAASGSIGLLILGVFLAWAFKPKHHTDDVPAKSPSQTAQSRPPAVPPTTVSGVIPANQAAQHINQRCTVEMVVVRAAKSPSTERYFLNSKQDYRAADNFTVTFTKSVLDQLRPKGIANEKALENKTIRITGVIILYNNLPEIDVGSADQIQIVSR